MRLFHYLFSAIGTGIGRLGHFSTGWISAPNPSILSGLLCDRGEGSWHQTNNCLTGIVCWRKLAEGKVCSADWEGLFSSPNWAYAAFFQNLLPIICGSKLGMAAPMFSNSPFHGLAVGSCWWCISTDGGKSPCEQCNNFQNIEFPEPFLCGWVCP